MRRRAQNVEGQETRTAVVPVRLDGASYRLAHDACHTAALLWDKAVDWVHDEWRQKRNPDDGDIQSFLTSLPRDERPLHANTTEIIAHDLYEAIKTSRANRKNGMKVRAPWRRKNYRPLSFTKGFGWRVTPKGQLALSLGRGRPRLLLEVPDVHDSATGQSVPPALWGEIQLCWDRDNRYWSLHIPYKRERASLPLPDGGGNVTAVDEGIINSMALATWADDRTIEVTVINGREGRATKRLRNKAACSLQKKIERAREGSKRHRRLVTAKKRVQGKTKDRLRDFDHQVSRRATDHVTSHQTGVLIYGDVRGIEQKTKRERRANRRHRQQLSQWSRGRQEKYVNEKTGLKGPKGGPRPRGRLDQDMSHVPHAQPPSWAGLPVQEPRVRVHLPPRRCRSSQHPPAGRSWGLHPNRHGHASPCHVSPGCRALVHTTAQGTQQCAAP